VPGHRGGATNQGAEAVGWTCNGLQNQFWLPSVTGGTDCPGFVEFQNLGSLYFLGVAGNSTNNGANVVQWHNQDTCNNQLWY
jgi:hypothetical protein